MKKLILEKAEDLKVFLDPFRSRIMDVVKDAEQPMTVKEIADSLGEVPAKVHYHVKKLESIGVLSVKRTKVINGIVAKYYDFTADSIALSVHREDERSDLSSLLVKTYGAYYDEAKQRFFDTCSSGKTPGTLKDGEVFLYTKNAIPIDPKRLDEFGEEISSLLEKYRCRDTDATNYSVFLSMVQIPKK